MRWGGGRGGICGRWLFVLLCGWLMAAVFCEGQGHFRFASIYWERNETETGHVVTYTIRSSWQRDYPAFQKVTGDVVRLTGFKVPTFSTADNSSLIGNVTLINLDLHVTSYSASGNWITGTTVISQRYSGPGPYDAAFSGCCVQGMPGNTPFSVSARVDMSQSSFSPAIVPVPTIWAVPGGNVSLPAQHPRGILGPVAATAGASPSDFYMYKWTLDSSITGVMLDPNTGNLAVASTAAVGQRIWVVVRVSIARQDGSPLSSHGSVAFFVQTMASGGGMPSLPVPQGLPGVNEMARRYEVRTGFKLSIEVAFTGLTMPASGDALELYTNERLPSRVSFQMLPAAQGQPPSKLKIAWDKPCVGDEQAIDFCFAAREVATGKYTPQMCINMRILMDIPPGFTEPDQEEFTAIMGRETTFRVSVVDAAAEDRVTNLGLAPGYTLPAGASITGLALMGNTGHLTFSYTPSPSAGGGMVELCFIANDIPVSTYDRCRGGTRSSTKCVKIGVERCRYAVRSKETISDVAALFSTDWVQLWALNPWIREPDYEVGQTVGTVLSTGHLYKVDSGDYLNAISFKFGTTLKQLLTLNADLAAGNDAVLAIGTELCVIPNSCIRD